MKITFTDTLGVPDEYFPKPSKDFIPQWYKDVDSYIGKEKKLDGKGNTKATIKRCMPVFDAITSGYIITSPADILVSQEDVIYNDLEHFQKTGETRVLDEKKSKLLPKTQPNYEWANFNLIQFHPVEQAPNHPNRNNTQVAYPKWINPWSIKTPKGYSTLFVQPFHRESPFTILPGVVDTDKYTAPVNFPFVLNDINFEGLIPAGTPIVQVIPFKRDSWNMKIGNEKDLKEQNKVGIKTNTKFFDSYKNQYRQLKEYK
jgi:hypothetical protein